MFMIMSREALPTFFEWLVRRCSPVFDLDLVEASSTSVEMLACTVEVRRGELVLLPKKKPLKAPLDPCSAHPRSVHLSWPISVMRNLRSLCSDPRDVEGALEFFLEKFRRSAFPISAIQLLERKAREICTGVSPSRPLPRIKNDFWMVVRFHPLLVRDLQRAVHIFSTDPFWSAVWKDLWDNSAPEIRIAWQSSLPTFLDVAAHRRIASEGGR